MRTRTAISSMRRMCACQIAPPAHEDIILNFGGSEKIRTSTTLILSQFPLPIGILIQSWRIQQESHLHFRPYRSGSLTIPLQVATRRSTAAYLMSRMKSPLNLWMHMFSWHAIEGFALVYQTQSESNRSRGGNDPPFIMLVTQS